MHSQLLIKLKSHAERLEERTDNKRRLSNLKEVLNSDYEPSEALSAFSPQKREQLTGGFLSDIRRAWNRQISRTYRTTRFTMA
jgi:hypothetical protein